MKFGVYTVYDCKTEEYCAPFIQRDGAVERTIKDMLSKSPVPAEDLTLWQVGTWDSETGEISCGSTVFKPVFVDVDFLGSFPDPDEEVDE